MEEDRETGCTCEIISHPELDGEFGPGVSVQVIKISPGCSAHAGPHIAITHREDS